MARVPPRPDKNINMNTRSELDFSYSKQFPYFNLMVKAYSAWMVSEDFVAKPFITLGIIQT